MGFESDTVSISSGEVDVSVVLNFSVYVSTMPDDSTLADLQDAVTAAVAQVMYGACGAKCGD